MTLLYKLLRYRSIPLYILFIVYLLAVQPALLEILEQVTKHDQPNLGLGILLLAIQFIELAAFYLKRPVMMHYIRQNAKSYQSPAQASILLFVFVPILHIGMAAFLYIAATQIGGFQPSAQAGFWPQMAFFLGFFVMIAKEGLLLQWWLTPFGKRGSQKKSSTSEIPLPQALLDLLGDLLLLAFASLGYTALWNFIAVESGIESGSMWQLVAQYFGVLLFYVMTVVPLRGVYYMFLPHLKLTKRQVILEWVGLAVSFIAAAAVIPVV